MLDIIHYYFEEDFYHPTEESALRKSALREALYTSLYDTEYAYAIKSENSKNTELYDSENEYETLYEPEESIKPFNPKAEPKKPYVPPTELNPDAAEPFGSILDAPLK